MKKTLLRIVIVVLCLGLLGSAAVFGVNAWVKGSVEDRIISPEEAVKLENVDCILVLGCYVRENGVPSDMLQDRLNRGIELYQAQAAPKLLMSGDHGQVEYDEVNAMKQYAMDTGIVSQDVFMDHAGFSTYESVYRARDIFQADRIIIVTQGYHLYRALYIAQQLGVEAWGVSADYRSYYGQFGRDVREVLARCKDFAMTVVQPLPTYLGEAIPVSGNGDATND